MSDTTSVNDKQKRMDIVISVIEGPRYRYRNFSWDGNTLFSNEILNRALNLKRCDYFNEEEFNAAVYNNM